MNGPLNLGRYVLALAGSETVLFSGRCAGVWPPLAVRCMSGKPGELSQRLYEAISGIQFEFFNATAKNAQKGRCSLRARRLGDDPNSMSGAQANQYNPKALHPQPG